MRLCELFDAVVVCVGHNSKPHVPEIHGIESFWSEIDHSHNYQENSRFAGKTVAFLGGLISGLDIALGASQTAQQVQYIIRFLLGRKLRNVFHMYRLWTVRFLVPFTWIYATSNRWLVGNALAFSASLPWIVSLSSAIVCESLQEYLCSRCPVTSKESPSQLFCLRPLWHRHRNGHLLSKWRRNTSWRHLLLHWKETVSSILMASPLFYSPLFGAAGGIFDPEDPVLEMSLSQWKKGQPIKKR